MVWGESVAMAGKKAGFWTYLALGVTLAGAYACVMSPPATSSRPDPEASARGACRLAAPDAMNDPGSVEFDPSDTWSVMQTTPSEWQVTLGLRATNAFGALVWGLFVCTVRKSGSTLTVTDFRQVN